MSDHRLVAVIFDIDGTLANIDHRKHFILDRETNWQKFFDEAINDGVYADVAALADTLHNCKFPILLVSGRPDSHRTITEEWLRNNFIEHEELHMRKAGDYRQDSVVKKEILAGLRERYHIWFVVDDRQQVVDMWRAEGLTCLQCASWEQQPFNIIDLLPKKDNEMNLTILIGPSGAGKTKACSGCKNVVVSSDNIRFQLTGDEENQEQNDLVFRALREIVGVRLKYGMHTIVDATNLRRKSRTSLLKLLPEGMRAQYWVFDTPLETCLLRNATRDRKVPEEVIRKQYDIFRSNFKDIERGDGFDFVEVRFVRG